MSGASLNIKEYGRELEVWRILSDVQCGLNYERDWAHVCSCHNKAFTYDAREV